MRAAAGGVRAVRRIGPRLAALRGARGGVLAVAAGAALTLAQPPLGIWPALFLGWPAALWLIEGAESGRRAAGRGWLFGAGFFLTGLYWVGEAFLAEGGRVWWYLPLMPVAVLALAAFLAIFWAAAFWAAWRWGRPGWGRAAALGLAIGLAELLRGSILTGFPWALQAYAWIDTPVFQSASLIGSYALTAFTAAAAAALGLLAGRGPGARAAPLAAAALLGAAWVWGAQRLDAAPEGAEAGRAVIRLVQPNVPQSEKWRPGNARPIFDNLLALTAAPAAGAPPALVVWPEVAVTFPFDVEPEAMRRAAEAAPPGAALALGAVRYAGPRGGLFAAFGVDGRPYNSLQFYGPDGEPLGVYDKRHLTPFGEYVPYADALGRIGVRALAQSFGGFGVGENRGPYALPGLPPAAVAICYEIIFPHEVAGLAEGAGWILQVTNDAWFGDSAGPWQHLAQARARAVEQGLPVARAANTGVSAMIDAHGRARASLGLDRRGVLDAPLPPPAPTTLYARLGLAAEMGCLTLLAMAVLIARRQKRVE